MQGTMFLTLTMLGWGGRLDAVAASQLKERGWEIGSHTMTHPVLTNVDDAVLHEELATSKRTRAPHRRAVHGSLLSDRTLRRTRRRGSRRGRLRGGCRSGAPGHPAGPLAWPRVGIRGDDSLSVFRVKCSRPVRRVRSSWLRRPAEGRLSGRSRPTTLVLLLTRMADEDRVVRVEAESSSLCLVPLLGEQCRFDVEAPGLRALAYMSGAPLTDRHGAWISTVPSARVTRRSSATPSSCGLDDVEHVNTEHEVEGGIREVEPADVHRRVGERVSGINVDGEPASSRANGNISAIDRSGPTWSTSPATTSGRRSRNRHSSRCRSYALQLGSTRSGTG